MDSDGLRCPGLSAHVCFWLVFRVLCVYLKLYFELNHIFSALEAGCAGRAWTDNELNDAIFTLLVLEHALHEVFVTMLVVDSALNDVFVTFLAVNNALYDVIITLFPGSFTCRDHLLTLHLAAFQARFTHHSPAVSSPRRQVQCRPL